MTYTPDTKPQVGPEYVQDFKRLNEISLGNLGKMKPKTTYDDFMEKARTVAKPRGVNKPALLLAMKYKSEQNTAHLTVATGGITTNVEFERPSTEVVYPITKEEWEQFISDTPHYLVEEPDVHAVDGDKFTAPI